jgi:hypothetical protein
MRLPFVNLGETGKLDHAALRVLRALARHEQFAMDEERLLSVLLNEELRRTVSDAARDLASGAGRPVVTQSELQEMRAEIQVLREENTALRVTLQQAETGAESRRFVTRMLAVAGSFSVLLTVLLTIVLKENISLFSSTTVASITGACVAGVVGLLAARLYVAGASGEVAQRWRGRLRQWLSGFAVIVVVNLGIAVLASVIYDAIKGR